MQYRPFLRMIKQILFRRLLLVLAQAEASAFYLVDLVSNDESTGVDAQYQIVECGKLTVGDDSENHFLVLLFQTGCCMNQCRTAVDFAVDGFIDFLKFRADNHNLCLVLSHNQDLVHHQAGQENDQNTVQNLLAGGVERLEQQKNGISYIQHNRDRKAKHLVQDDGRNVQTAGRTADLNDHTDAHTNHQACVDGSEELVAGQGGDKRDFSKEGEEERVQDCAHDDGSGKLFSHDHCTQNEENQVGGQYADINGKSEEVLQNQTDTGYPAGNQSVWHYEPRRTQRKNCVAYQDKQKHFNLFFHIHTTFLLIHIGRSRIRSDSHKLSLIIALCLKIRQVFVIKRKSEK